MTLTTVGQRSTSWVQIDLNAVKHNFREVRRHVGNSVQVMAVVKADAYGHGAVRTASALSEAGAEYLGVTTVEEGMELRNSGISTPILVFSPVLADQMEAALLHNLDLTVCDHRLAEQLSAVAGRCARVAHVHIKVDTGMGRLGIDPGDSVAFVRVLAEMPNIAIAGIYTHFANAGAKDLRHARGQNAKFSIALDSLKAAGIGSGLRHAASSSAILSLPESRYDMVRPGTILYGQYPTRSAEAKLDLQDTWSLRTRIVAVRKLPKGAQVGYGSEYTTTRPTIAAVIPIGYSDGFTVVPESAARRSMSPARTILNTLLRRASGPHVVINGDRYPVIGRVSMQMCTVDITDAPGVDVGHEIVVPARRTTTSARIPRVYKG